MTNGSKLTFKGRLELADLADRCASEYAQYGDNDYPEDPAERDVAASVRKAVMQLGVRDEALSIPAAAAVWEAYSQAHESQWLDAPKTVDSIRAALIDFSNAVAEGKI